MPILWDLVARQQAGWEKPLTIGSPAYDRWLRSEYNAATAVLSQRGARVVWLSPLCVKNLNGPAVGVFDPESISRLDQDIVKPIAQTWPDRASYLDLFSVICPEERYTNEFDGIEDFRPDGVHFSPAGEHWVGEWLGAQLLALPLRNRAPGS